jgi:hypothetical protein
MEVMPIVSQGGTPAHRGGEACQAGYNYNKVRFTLVFGLLLLSPASGFAEPERAIVPLKPAAVPERRLELPFDLKTEPNIKFRGPDSVPAALVPTKEHKPFVGFGLTRPLEVPK